MICCQISTENVDEILPDDEEEEEEEDELDMDQVAALLEDNENCELNNYIIIVIQSIDLFDITIEVCR
jgi:hypothetical protein